MPWERIACTSAVSLYNNRFRVSKNSENCWKNYDVHRRTDSILIVIFSNKQSFLIIIEICIILCTKLDWPRSSDTRM